MSKGAAFAPATSGAAAKVAGTPLGESEIAAIEARLSPWVDDATLVKAFNRPTQSLAVPRAGTTVSTPFPPAGTSPAPPTASGGPLTRVQPEGAVAIASFVTVTFNQPMVPVATIEQLDATQVPATITPAVPGRWRWVGTQTLRFDATDPLVDRLPMATEYTVTVPAGTTSATGRTLAKERSFSFATPAPGVQSSQPSTEPAPHARPGLRPRVRPARRRGGTGEARRADRRWADEGGAPRDAGRGRGRQADPYRRPDRRSVDRAPSGRGVAGGRDDRGLGFRGHAVGRGTAPHDVPAAVRVAHVRAARHRVEWLRVERVPTRVSVRRGAEQPARRRSVRCGHRHRDASHPRHDRAALRQRRGDRRQHGGAHHVRGHDPRRTRRRVRPAARHEAGPHRRGRPRAADARAVRVAVRDGRPAGRQAVDHDRHGQPSQRARPAVRRHSGRLGRLPALRRRVPAGVVADRAAPTGVVEQFGGLDITTSSTALQGHTDAVLSILQNPYDSVETRASRILAIAKAAGYVVPADALGRALQFAANVEALMATTYSEVVLDTVRAYALHVCNLAGDRDTGQAEQLWTARGDELGVDALAWLWPVVGDGATGTEIARLIDNRAVETAGAVNFASSYDDGAYVILQSDRRIDAIVLDALIAQRPASALIPKIVTGLLGHRTGGRSARSQESSFILVALQRYFDAYERQTPDFVGRVWLGDRFAGDQRFAGRSTDRLDVNLPTTELVAAGNSSVVVAKEGTGRLYYRIGLRYAPATLQSAALDRGFVVQRTYEGVDNAG